MMREREIAAMEALPATIANMTKDFFNGKERRERSIDKPNTPTQNQILPLLRKIPQYAKTEKMRIERIYPMITADPIGRVYVCFDDKNRKERERERRNIITINNINRKVDIVEGIKGKIREVEIAKNPLKRRIKTDTLKKYIPIKDNIIPITPPIILNINLCIYINFHILK